jgi:hypothetical protein
MSDSKNINNNENLEIQNEINFKEKNEDKENSSSYSDNGEDIESFDSNDERYIELKRKYLENPETFEKKKEFFSFYAKYGNILRQRKSALIPYKKGLFGRHFRKTSQIIDKAPDYKRFSQFELRPRGFGINIKEKIEFFEKKILENQYKPLNLTQHQRKYYDNNELRKFDLSQLKVINVEEERKNNNKEYQNKFIRNNFRVSEVQFSFGNNSNENKKKLNLDLKVDYSKIINSSKVTKSEKGLDLFLTENNNKGEKNNAKSDKKLILTKNNDSSDSDSFTIKETPTTKFIRNTKNQEIIKHNRLKSQVFDYNDLMKRMIGPTRKISCNINDNSKIFKDVNNNNKYVLVKSNDNKMILEKISSINNNSKVYQNISDNTTLNKLDNAKHKLNQVNNNKKIKRQIIDMLSQLITDNNKNTNTNKKSEKINNLYDKQKLNRAFKLLPKLSLIKQKINTYIQNSENLYETNDKNKFDEDKIKSLASTIYFLECIGLEHNIFFNENEGMKNKTFINDVNENIQLIGVNNKKKYIKSYAQNMNELNFLIELLINNINRLQSNINVNSINSNK